jgi:hypothetical protein
MPTGLGYRPSECPGFLDPLPYGPSTLRAASSRVRPSAVTPGRSGTVAT